MGLFSNKWFYTLCALFAFFVVTGDLVADAVHDATGGCVTESQSGGHDSCPACSGCAIHSATALVDSGAVTIGGISGAGAYLPEENNYCAVGLPAAIDHPPQLG
jgi:hypothetical protein